MLLKLQSNRRLFLIIISICHSDACDTLTWLICCSPIFLCHVYVLQFVLSLLVNSAGMHFLGEVTLNDRPFIIECFKVHSISVPSSPFFVTLSYSRASSTAITSQNSPMSALRLMFLSVHQTLAPKLPPSRNASNRNLRIITGGWRQQKQAAAVTRPGTEPEVICKA